MYIPRMGYPDVDLHACYEQLKCVVAEGHSMNYWNIFGGDFNTQLGVGLRGELVQELCETFSLNMANDDEHHDPAMSTWTVRSSTGVMRRIDNLLHCHGLPLVRAFATDQLDLGSDHRPVDMPTFGSNSACQERSDFSHETWLETTRG